MSMFLCIFWITSHQYFKEKITNLTDRDTFLKIFGHKSGSEHRILERSLIPRLLRALLKSISNFISRIWMWILVFLIFMCAMAEKSMTGFRICYMSLFLLFLLVFEMSLKLWLKFLYGYWIFVIFYAMTMLTIIYTYQFDSFDKYWEQYLHVLPTL